MNMKTKSRPWSRYPSKQARGKDLWTAGVIGTIPTIYAFRPKDGQIVATFHQTTPSGLSIDCRENAAAFVDAMNERLKCQPSTSGASAKSKPKDTARRRVTQSVLQSTQDM